MPKDTFVEGECIAITIAETKLAALNCCHTHMMKKLTRIRQSLHDFFNKNKEEKTTLPLAY